MEKLKKYEPNSHYFFTFRLIASREPGGYQSAVSLS